MRRWIDERAEVTEESWSTTDWLNTFNILRTILRVIIIISVWLLLFLAVFLGYLTVPVFFLVVFAFLYATTRLARWGRKPFDKRHRRTDTQ